jgi:hypothetical protein
MSDALLSSLKLAGAGGHVIVFAIVVLLVLGICSNLYIRGRYAVLSRELRGDAELNGAFRARVLNRILHEAGQAVRRNPADINTPAIIEHSFQLELGGLLLGERYGKSAVGLMIILGLVGTFYGLTLSIGKLVNLISGEGAAAADIAQAVTAGLTEALSGMSVAFSCSLFGIGAAITLTVLGIFSSIPERRMALMVQIEHYLDNVLLSQVRGQAREENGVGVDADTVAAGAGVNAATRKLEQLVGNFGQSVSQLEGVITRFDSALQNFAATTRDFREFNLHLKDNVQRMSLNFGDLSETLKTHVGALKSRDPR